MNGTSSSNGGTGGGALLQCALSGETPPADPVVTPSGHICSRRLLLTKLTENGGVDPFDSASSGSGNPRTLDESDLIELKLDGGSAGAGAGAGGGGIVPPRLPTASSLPSLLGSVQAEYDSLLLELYDTRRTLEDTRRELSQALYQNDASVRVVARLVMERDGAREQLAAMSAQVSAAAANASAAAPAAAAASADGGRKRARDENGEEQGETKKAKEANGGGSGSGGDGSDGSKIPQPDVDSMMATWKAMSKDRKKKSKNKDKGKDKDAPPAGVTMDTVQSMEETGKKSLHKSSAKAGLLSISSLSGGNLIVTTGRDRQAVVYNTDDGKVVATLVGSGGAASKADLTGADIVKSVDDGAVLVATGSVDGSIRVYATPPDGSDGTGGSAATDFAPCGTITLADESIVDVSIHPSGKYVIAALRSGRVAFAALRDGGVLEEVAVLDGKADGAEYTCADLHPDGLIYVVGTASGAVQVWDLSKQAPAGSVQAQGAGDEGVGIASLVMSDNGYHVATSTTAGTVQVWDLRKLKCVATMNADGADVGPVVKSASFSPGEGKLLAYGGAKGTITVVGVKDWDNKTTLSMTPPKKGDAPTITGLVWTHGGMSMASCSDSDRPVRFWGKKE